LILSWALQQCSATALPVIHNGVNVDIQPLLCVTSLNKHLEILTTFEKSINNQ